MLINITEEQLMKLLRTYFESEVEACPLNAQAFCNILFHKYGCKKIHPDSRKMVVLE